MESSIGFFVAQVVKLQMFFCLKTLWGFMIQFDEHIFQVVWFNHELEIFFEYMQRFFPCIYILKHLELSGNISIFTLQVTINIVHSSCANLRKVEVYLHFSIYLRSTGCRRALLVAAFWFLLGRHGQVRSHPKGFDSCCDYFSLLSQLYIIMINIISVCFQSFLLMLC